MNAVADKLGKVGLPAPVSEFAKTRWEVSAKQPEDDTQLIETTEGIVAAENAGWVQQMLLKPVVPDQPATGTAATR